MLQVYLIRFFLLPLIGQRALDAPQRTKSLLIRKEKLNRTRNLFPQTHKKYKGKTVGRCYNSVKKVSRLKLTRNMSQKNEPQSYNSTSLLALHIRLILPSITLTK